MKRDSLVQDLIAELQTLDPIESETVGYPGDGTWMRASGDQSLVDPDVIAESTESDLSVLEPAINDALKTILPTESIDPATDITYSGDDNCGPVLIFIELDRVVTREQQVAAGGAVGGGVDHGGMTVVPFEQGTDPGQMMDQVMEQLMGGGMGGDPAATGGAFMEQGGAGPANPTEGMFDAALEELPEPEKDPENHVFASGVLEGVDFGDPETFTELLEEYGFKTDPLRDLSGINPDAPDYLFIDTEYGPEKSVLTLCDPRNGKLERRRVTAQEGYAEELSFSLPREEAESFFRDLVAAADSVKGSIEPLRTEDGTVVLSLHEIELGD